jgi:uncharacterized protein (DUF2235 family)
MSARLWMRPAAALQLRGRWAGCRLGAAASRGISHAASPTPGAHVGKNILIFSDGTGQAGGFMPDEARSNVYKLFRATRVAPDSSIDPKLQLAFYDAGLGARGQGDAIKITWLRLFYNLLSKATGLGITQNIIDCYAEIIRVWQPGDRIYLFGFSRGAYTLRCVGGVLKACGVPTAVRQGGRVRPLRRDARTARRIATEAVKHVYQYGGSMKGDPYRAERIRRAARFRRRYFSGDATVSNTAPYFIGAWDTVQTLGAGTRGLVLLALVYEAMSAGLAAWTGIDFWVTFLLVGLGLPLALYGVACLRYKGLVSLARYRMAFYDTKLNYAVRYARHALSIDEDRASFDCVPWDEEPARQAFTDQPTSSPPRFKQVWFAGSHSDVGGSYPETEARLSDIALAWMTQEAMNLPHPIYVDFSSLKLYPDDAGPQHDERKAFIANYPRWFVRCALKFGWRQKHRHVPPDALLHPSVIERLRLPAVLIHGEVVPYRPRALRQHPLVRDFWQQPATAPARSVPPPLPRRVGRPEFEIRQRPAGS